MSRTAERNHGRGVGVERLTLSGQRMEDLRGGRACIMWLCAWMDSRFNSSPRGPIACLTPAQGLCYAVKARDIVITQRETRAQGALMRMPLLTGVTVLCGLTSNPNQNQCPE